jgi:hypothetical protein
MYHIEFVWNSLRDTLNEELEIYIIQRHVLVHQVESGLSRWILRVMSITTLLAGLDLGGLFIGEAMIFKGRAGCNVADFSRRPATLTMIRLNAMPVTGAIYIVY